MKSVHFSRKKEFGDGHRRGISIVEVFLVVAVLGILLTLASPWIVSAREMSRRNSCGYHLRQLGSAMDSYHDAFRSLPAAGIWSTGKLDSLAIHKSRRIDLYTQSNWAIALLPFAGQADLAAQFHDDALIGSSANDRGRNTQLPLMNCPSDSFNNPKNRYVFEPTKRESFTFARGNYAINGGSHIFNDRPRSTAFLTGDGAHLIMDRSTREFEFWGNGVAGFNVSFSRDDFENGAGSLVLLEEVRAGIHPMDPRGVWALGQIGGSVTWAHGVNGDAYGPNNPWHKSDDILNGDLLNKTVGKEFLRKTQMPCVDYVNFNSQATARSAHPGGVNLLMVDGAARFVSDTIDAGLWHAMHSRETPHQLLNGDFDARIVSSRKIPDKPVVPTELATLTEQGSAEIENSLGMRFSLIPAGEFEMGRADQGNDFDLPEESPQHTVQITQPFYIGMKEVIRSQFLTVMGFVPEADSIDATNTGDLGDFPVDRVTWHEAETFCRKLSELSEERAAGRRFRLPTEAEWEYACRAGNRVPYVWSSVRRADDVSGDAAGILPPLPLCRVGSYSPNAYGLYDMRGNCWEWCADWFDRSYYARSPKENPQGPRDGYIKVIRGSDWTYVGEGCKLSYPVMAPWKSSPFVGFRVVCEYRPLGQSEPQ